jgi:hypothetical protein
LKFAAVTNRSSAVGPKLCFLCSIITNNNKHQVPLCLSVNFPTGLSVSLSACSCICAFMVKNPFGLLQMLYFDSNVIEKSYRQVLTPVNNSQLILKLEIPDKFRLVTLHAMAT